MITENPQGLDGILNAMQRDIENSDFEHALSKVEFIENGILRSSLRDKINHCTSIARALDTVSLLIGKEKMVEALALLQETTIPEDLDFLLRRAAHLRKLIDSYGSGVSVVRESPAAAVPVCDRGAPVVYASPPPPVTVPVRGSQTESARESPPAAVQVCDRGAPVVYASPPPPVAVPVSCSQAPVAYESLVAGISSVVAAPSVMAAESKKADERVRCPVCHRAIQVIEVEDKAQSLRCPMCGYTSKREFFFGSTQKPAVQRKEPTPPTKKREVAAVPCPRNFKFSAGAVSFNLENGKLVRIDYDLQTGASIYLQENKLCSFTGEELRQWQELEIGGHELALRFIKHPWLIAWLFRKNGLQAKLDGVRIRGIYGDPKERIKGAPICFLLCLISYSLTYFHTDDDIYKMYSTVAMAAIIGLYLIFLRYKLFAVSMALVLAIFDAVVFAQNAIQAELFVTAPLPLLGFSLIRMIVLLLLLRLYMELLQLGRLKS